MYALLALVAVSSLVAAMPTRRADDVPSWCANLGGGVFDTASNFTLAAFNTSGFNSNSSGTPLALADAGEDNGIKEAALATITSFSQSKTASFSLDQGHLKANTDGSNTFSTGAQADSAIQFLTTNDASKTPAQVFCAMADTDPENGTQPILAVNNAYDQFSLCMTTSDPKLNVVVFNATHDNESIDSDSCYPVDLHIIGLQ